MPDIKTGSSSEQALNGLPVKKKQAPCVLREIRKQCVLYALIALALPVLFLSTGVMKTEDFDSWSNLLLDDGYPLELALIVKEHFPPQ